MTESENRGDQTERIPPVLPKRWDGRDQAHQVVFTMSGSQSEFAEFAKRFGVSPTNPFTHRIEVVADTPKGIAVSTDSTDVVPEDNEA